MTAKLIDGKRIAQEIVDEVRSAVEKVQGKKPGLAFILVGEHPASQSYVRAKQRACAITGIVSTLIALPNTVTMHELLAHIDELNCDPSINGILVQLPLPVQIDERRVMLAIDPAKDVDGFHPLNIGKLLLGDPSAMLPCTPHGIQVLLERSGIDVGGKHVVIMGRSNIVGKPLAALLMQKGQGANATVTVCHSKSEGLVQIVRSADILVVAVGKAGVVGPDLVNPGIVVVDVGINRVGGAIVGDVDPRVKEVVEYITPVPGGVGPMTIAMLVKNTWLSYARGLVRHL